MNKDYYSLAVIYKGLDKQIDKRVKQALKGSGLRFDGGGYFFLTNERDLVFLGSKPNLPAVRKAMRNIRRWKYVSHVILAYND